MYLLKDPILATLPRGMSS